MPTKASKTSPDNLPLLESEASDVVSLAGQYRAVRECTERLCEPLVTEDYVIQSMPDVSPTKWHLAHTSWFFETFILKAHRPRYEPFHPRYAYLFNSYYVQAGERHCRPKRGLLSRPTVEEVYKYRARIDAHISEFLETTDDQEQREISDLVELGLNHEQQHQELIVTDIKHVLSRNPLRPVYQDRKAKPNGRVPAIDWVPFRGGLHEIGHNGRGFAFDNEMPRHRAFVEPFQLASRPVTNGEFLEFIESGGYQRPEIWLSDGWDTVVQERWSAPLYWERHDGRWYMYTLGGMREVDETEPVCHVSYFEADAYARWAGARLPTEEELEVATQGVRIAGNFVENGHFHPVSSKGAEANGALLQIYGNLWEWTRSPYSPYPGYRPPPGAVGEYNGKFMCNQFVLRGGSCATPQAHIRPTYRNFFYPTARWQFTGIRLAKDA